MPYTVYMFPVRIAKYSVRAKFMKVEEALHRLDDLCMVSHPISPSYYEGESNKLKEALHSLHGYGCICPYPSQ